VSAGTLLVNGNQTGAGAVNVNGGTLGGTGSVAGAVNVNAGGTLSPGGDNNVESLGTGTLTFNATAATSSTLKYEIGGVGIADLVNAVNGGLNIADSANAGSAPGTILALSYVGPTPFNIPNGNKFTVIAYNGNTGAGFGWNGK